MTTSLGEVVVGDLFVLLLFVPVGLVTLRVLERVLSRRFALTPVERVLLAFYSAGALLYLLASVPIPWYGSALVLAVLAAGAAAYGGLLLWERGRSCRAGLRFVRTPVGLLLVSGFVLLLVYGLIPVWDHPFPNAWDGSVTALWTNLTLAHHTLPTNLEPFAPAPVVYPLGTTVWMTTPVILFGWSIVQTIVVLPPLFLSLTVLAAYSWGARWARPPSPPSERVGLLFAGFFGLVASWPRFYTGGSYDFAFALPLLLLGLAILPDVVRPKPRPWREIVGLGLFTGVITSLSVAAGEALLVLLVGYILVAHRQNLVQLGRWWARVLVVGAFAAAAVFRGVGALGGAKLTPYNVANAYGPLDGRLIQSSLNPFVPWKYLISPFPALSLLLQLLLVTSVVLAAYGWVHRTSSRLRWFPQPLARDLLIGTSIAFAMTAMLLLTDLPGPSAETLREFSNLPEESVVLTIFYSALAAVPLVGALTYLTRRQAGAARPAIPLNPSFGVRRFGVLSRARGSTRPIFSGIVALLVVSAPLALGAAVSIADGPAFTQQNVGKTSNVTSGDVAGMQWVGSNLPGCSRIFVAPGSAAQFLPEFAATHVLYPMNPVPTNASYVRALGDLIAGQYSGPTRTALLALLVTEVFVTGPTSVSYPAIALTALDGSSDFVLLFSSGDAAVFEFSPGVSLSGCPG